MTMVTRWVVLLCGASLMQGASAQDEAASALAECQLQQQRLQEMEDTVPPAADPGWTMSRGLQPQSDVQYQRVLTDRACTYAKALREKPEAPKPRPVQRPRSTFRSDAPAYRPAAEPAFRSDPPAAPPAVVAPSPPPQPVMRREPPAQSNVGGTKPRRAPDEPLPTPQ